MRTGTARMARDRKPAKSEAELWRRATGGVKPLGRKPPDRKPPDCKPDEPESAPRAPAGASPSDREPNESESDLWRRATGDVRPLDRAGAPAPEADPEPRAPARRRPAAPPQPPQRAAPELRHGDSPGVDRRTADNLRRGKLAIEARIDLHGMTQIEAHRALNAFIVGQQEAGRRCVLVVTGKGREGGGVLRAAAPQWLNAPELRPRVLTFAYAQPRDGGEGALYILLRRRR